MSLPENVAEHDVVDQRGRRWWIVGALVVLLAVGLVARRRCRCCSSES